MFKVTEERCDQCLFGENKVVSDARRRDILAECAAKDTHFQCHKGTINGEDICCKGFYDTQTSQMIRIAQRLGAVEYVPVPTVTAGAMWHAGDDEDDDYFDDDDEWRE